MRVVRVPDRDVLKHAAEVSRKVADFPGIPLNIEAMTQPGRLNALSKSNSVTQVTSEINL